MKIINIRDEACQAGFANDWIEAYPSTIVHKKWGYEKVLINIGLFCGKILHYNLAGAISSFHFHSRKTEYFLCLSGAFKFRYKDDSGNTVETEMKKDDAVLIPNCRPHQLESLEENSEILEISTFHSDKDVTRIEPGDSQRQ